MNVATYQFSGKLLVELFQSGSMFGADFEDRINITKGIPRGAIIRDARYNPRRDTLGDGYGILEILVEHESFDELGDADDMWGNVQLIETTTESKPKDDKC